MKKKRTGTRAAAMFFTAIIAVMTLPAGTLKVRATTFEDLNAPEVFLKQAQSNTCTLCSAAIMMRRYSMLRGDGGGTAWKTITEAAVRPAAWTANGLLWNFSYSNSLVPSISVGCVSRLPGGGANKSKILDELAAHPEGIVIYTRSAPHAICVTDYTDGVFYCADPANDAPRGRISISEQKRVTIGNVAQYWKITSPAVPGPGPDPVPCSISFSADSLTLKEGDQQEVTAGYLGDGVASVDCGSSDTSVCSVSWGQLDEQGEKSIIVSANSQGSASVTFYLKNTDDKAIFEKSFPVTVLERGIPINEANFPDANFRNFVLTGCDNTSRVKIDGDGDGYLTSQEIAAVKDINVTGSSFSDPGKISDLAGIEIFTAMTKLDCSGNRLTNLDLGQNTGLTPSGLTCTGNRFRLPSREGVPLSSLPGDFDLSKVSNAAGGSFDAGNNTFSLDAGSLRATYDYDAGNGHTVNFTFTAPSDVNGDGKINIIDARWVLQALSGNRILTPDQMELADADGDRQVTVIDVRWLLQVSSGYRVHGRGGRDNNMNR